MGGTGEGNYPLRHRRAPGGDRHDRWDRVTMPRTAAEKQRRSDNYAKKYPNRQLSSRQESPPSLSQQTNSHQGPLTSLRYGRGCSSGGGTRFGPLSCTFGVTVNVTVGFAMKPPLFQRAKRAPRAKRALQPAAGGNFFVGIRILEQNLLAKLSNP